MLPYQTKNTASEIKDVDVKAGIVTGYFSTFDVLDDGGDIIPRGAFKKTLKERGPESDRPRIKHLFMHDAWQILGTPQVLKEDKKGLYFETQIVDTTLGKDALKLYEAGAISEHSIGYDAVKSEYDPSQKTPYGPARILSEVRLWEGSAVTWGMNSDTLVVGIKSGIPDKQLLLKTLDTLQSVLKHGHLSSDEICEQLELWAVQLKSFITALDQTEEPDTSTQQIDEPQNPDVTPLLTLRDSLKSIVEV
jgi:hypothetical protein